jgi:hypothetical protein
MRTNILCDLDHVVANSFWRDPMIGGPWDEYHAASINDQPLPDIVNLLNALPDEYYIVGLTGRDEKWRQLTIKWLLMHDVPMDELLMRPTGDWRPAPAMKVKLATERFPDITNEVAFILDDREDVIAAFKALGVTALHVNGRAK